MAGFGSKFSLDCDTKTTKTAKQLFLQGLISKMIFKKLILPSPLPLCLNKVYCTNCLKSCLICNSLECLEN